MCISVQGVLRICSEGHSEMRSHHHKRKPCRRKYDTDVRPSIKCSLYRGAHTESTVYLNFETKYSNFSKQKKLEFSLTLMRSCTNYTDKNPRN